MKTFLFSDSDVFQFSIVASTYKGALLKAKHIFGIHVPLRKIAHYGAFQDFRSSITGYRCTLQQVTH